MTIKASDAALGVCTLCQSLQPISRRTDLLYAELDSPNGPFGCGEAGHYVMDSHLFGESNQWCDGVGTTPQAVLAMEEVAGKAPCGCWYHAEQGIPCPHDVALAIQTAVAP